MPSAYGIGCFSKAAYDFVDFLKRAGQSYWQILPLCPTGFGDSPYQSFSTFAGNPYMISLESLKEENLITRDECDSLDFGNDETTVDYEKQFNNRFTLLNKAFERSKLLGNMNYDKFVAENSFWLEDYAFFMALKYKFSQKSWNKWDHDIKKREEAAIMRYKTELKNQILFWKFVQFKFYEQWKRLKDYANQNGISIIGDIPIYVSFDSSDVWANPHLFELDGSLMPISVAGCPPDGFSKTGQLWGNPLYCWDEHKKEDYSWWCRRMEFAYKIYDVVRLDHFRGFDEYYSIPYPSPDAVNGKWRKGPGAELFKKIYEKTQKRSIIAEDLGFVTETVKEMLIECGFPGMKVLEFAFDERDTGISGDYIPHNYPLNSVAYTGTHDNQTLSSWFETISDKERTNVRKYLCDQYTPNNKIHLPLIALVMRSSSCLCIIPMQDWLGLGDDARINTPATTGNNWRWRIDDDMLTHSLAEEIKEMTEIFGRI